MERYRICFFNDLPDSTGHDHHVCQRTIELSGMEDETQAIAEAIARFERMERVVDWRLHARTLECSRITGNERA